MAEAKSVWPNAPGGRMGARATASGKGEWQTLSIDTGAESLGFPNCHVEDYWRFTVNFIDDLH